VIADSLLRAALIGSVPLIWLAGLLTPSLYVVLLAISSLLHAWGNAATYSVLAELLPEEHRLAANTLVSSLSFAATIAGPAIAGVMVSFMSAAYVLGLDALTCLFLAVVVARTPIARATPAAPVDRAAARGGFSLLRSRRALLGLLALTWVFNLLYGPVEVALPLHVTDDLHASGALLGLYWMLFGIGALVGGLAVVRDHRDRGRLGALAGAVRVRRADRGHGRLLHDRRRDLRTVRAAVRDPDAGEVPARASDRDARRPKRGPAHSVAPGYGAGRPVDHGLGSTRHPGRLRRPDGGARRRGGTPALRATREVVRSSRVREDRSARTHVA
jgi:hypothetical protein